MKKALLISTLNLFAFASFSQIVIGESTDGRYGLFAHGTGTMIEPVHDTMIAFEGVMENYGVLGDDGVFTLYYDNVAEDTLEIIETEFFTDVQTYYPEDEEKARIIIRDSLGNSWFLDKDGNWTGPEKPSGMYGACNSNYRYALFLNGKMLTKYLYHYIYQPETYTHDGYEPFLFGQVDSGYMVMDSLGKLIYPFAIDRCWPALYAEGAYVCSSEDHWGVFSLNGKYFYPITELLDGWSAFDIDDAAYTDLKYPVIAKKNGKWGRETIDGEIVFPFENDQLYSANPGKSYIRLKDGKWEQLKVKKPKVIMEHDFDEWYGLNLLHGKWYGIVKKNGRIVHIELKSGKERLDTDSFFLIKALTITARHTDDNKYVGYNNKGEIIVPYPNDYLRAMEKDDLKYFIVSKDDKWGLIGADGKVMLHLLYEHIAVFYRVKNFLGVMKDGKYALAAWDDNEKTWKFKTDFKFVDIRGAISDGLAVGTVEGGTEYTIYEDGSMRIKK